MTRQPWDPREIDLIKYLAQRPLSLREIADTLAIAGFPAREETTIQNKARKLGVEFKGDRNRG